MVAGKVWKGWKARLLTNKRGNGIGLDNVRGSSYAGDLGLSAKEIKGRCEKST